MSKTNTAVQPAQNQTPAPVEPKTAKSLFNQDNVKTRFAEILGKKSVGFIASVLQCTAQNSSLAKADPNSILQAAMIAATLDLPINANLGFAYIIPYDNSIKDKDGNWQKITQGQFQVGWRGFVQLAQRSGQYLKINVVEVFQNQFKSYNTLTEELDADFSIDGEGDIVGYVAYFKLLNGFEKTVYWSKAKVTAHAQKYSKAFSSQYGKSPWKDVDQFHEMAKKTVLKNTLSKWGPLSIEMQTAMKTDQAVIKDADTQDIDYSDVEPLQIEDPENKRFGLMVDDCKTVAELEKLRDSISNDVQNDLYNQQLNALS
jgi:recombination protein RecT